jgi:hypothetical protein
MSASEGGELAEVSVSPFSSSLTRAPSFNESPESFSRCMLGSYSPSVHRMILVKSGVYSNDAGSLDMISK